MWSWRSPSSQAQDMVNGLVAARRRKVQRPQASENALPSRSRDRRAETLEPLQSSCRMPPGARGSERGPLKTLENSMRLTILAIAGLRPDGRPGGGSKFALPAARRLSGHQGGGGRLRRQCRGRQAHQPFLRQDRYPAAEAEPGRPDLLRDRRPVHLYRPRHEIGPRRHGRQQQPLQRAGAGPAEDPEASSRCRRRSRASCWPCSGR